MPVVTIGPEETEELISEQEAAEVANDPNNEKGFRYEVLSGRVSFGHQKDFARDGLTYRPGSNANVNPYGEPFYAYNQAGTDARVFVEPATFLIQDFDSARESGSGVESFSFSTSGGAEQIPVPLSAERQVLGRAEVLVQNSYANENASPNVIRVGGAFGQHHEIVPGSSVGFAVSDPESIRVDAPSGLSVNVSYEV